MVFYAHSPRISSDKAFWHRLGSHLNVVGESAGRRGSKIGVLKAALLAGTAHDLGKYSEDFVRRIEGSPEAVDHSTAGAWHVLQDMPDHPDRLMAELAAYAIAGHHAGLPDMLGGASSLSDRLRRYSDTLSPEWTTEVALERQGLMPSDFKFVGHDGKASMGFRFAMLGRYIFSCLVDSDYRDTEAYYDGLAGRARDRDFQPLQDLLPVMEASLSSHMSTLGGRSGILSQARSEIFESIVSKAGLKPGLFTMNVPTGGGKTLASLAFALKHAAAHGMDRIIYGIPFTSVIDQTASIFRNILGEANVLEHHSAIGEADTMSSGEARLRMATEDWSAPVVVTTNVQFFESLMAASPSRARKIHNIARSVIILDEAQTIPRHLLMPCVAILDELARNYGCTIILCTATQPAFNDAVLAAGHRLALPVTGRELAPDPFEMGKRLRRVTFRHAGNMDDAEIAAAMSAEPQALAIVNSRKHALQLYRLLKEDGIGDIYHLSTRQTAADRRRVLAEVRQRLKDKLPCRVVSTSLIEAGVDIDFPRVWRCEAGLDQIAQAAGRCNREGSRAADESIVTIFSSREYPAPKEIQGLVRDMKAAIAKYGDILSPEAIQTYFLETYWRVGADGLDTFGIMDLFHMSPKGTNFSYRSAADLFKLVDSKDRTIIIASSSEARRILAGATDAKVRSVDLARRLQQHIVQVPGTAFEKLKEKGKISAEAPNVRDQEFMVLRDGSLYCSEFGIEWDLQHVPV